MISAENLPGGWDVFAVAEIPEEGCSYVCSCHVSCMHLFAFLDSDASLGKVATQALSRLPRSDWQ